MSLFKVNIDKLNLLVLPTMLRKPMLYAICKALSSPIKTIYDSFMARRKSTLFALKYDSSKYSIERYLNLAFSDGGMDIYITNVRDTRAKGLPQFIPFYMRDDVYGTTQRKYMPHSMPFFIDSIAKTADFTVYVPSTLSSQVDNIRAAVDRLKLPPYTFEVVIYE